MMPNEEKYEGMWREAMQEPMPLYFNPDGTRTNAYMQSRDVSPRATNVHLGEEDYLIARQTQSANSIVEMAPKEV